VNAWDEIERALHEAENIESAARYHANRMARLLAGQLRARRVEARYLAELKRELRDFNLTTGAWSDPK
jgi:hypothetical protein